MAVGRIESVSVDPAGAPELVGCFIDLPNSGSELGTYCVDVAGWVLGRSGAVTGVEVVVEGIVLQTALVGKPRPDILRAFPDVPGADNCGFGTRVNLVSTPRQFEIKLRAVFDDGRRCVFGGITGERCRFGLERETTVQPLIVATFGRSGSTWVMRLLGQHPEIVAYRPFAFETRGGTYWIDVFRALSEPKSYLQPFIATSLHKQWWLGPESLDAPRHIPDQHVVEFLGGASITSLARLCHEQLDAYYHEMAAGAKYFAEKFMLPPVSRRLLLEWYPRGKEIVLVRDPRDLFCSVESFNAKRGNVVFMRQDLPDDAEYMRMLVKRMCGLLSPPQGRSNAAHIVRYEDIVMEPARTLEAVLDYLEIDSGTDVVARMLEKASTGSKVMREHQTSRSPAESVGRWREDLPAHLRELCESEFGESMAQFGYR
jgi:hypothetical protein